MYDQGAHTDGEVKDYVSGKKVLGSTSMEDYRKREEVWAETGVCGLGEDPALGCFCQRGPGKGGLNLALLAWRF